MKHSETQCKICSETSSFHFTARLLKKYDVSYYKCESCGFVQTEKPYWLSEAYSSAITSQDIGLIWRNNYYSPITANILKLFFNKKGKYLDYGGGYGMFVRLMRDNGFDFYRYDTYCKNLFSEGYDHQESNEYDFITAFEVFEHLESPLVEIENMLGKCRSIFFSTELQPSIFNDESDWWYVMPETGQHISLYSLESLRFIASKYQLNLYSNGNTLHLLSDKKLNPLLFKLCINQYTSKLLNNALPNPKTLLMTDYGKISG